MLALSILELPKNELVSHKKKRWWPVKLFTYQLTVGNKALPSRNFKCDFFASALLDKMWQNIMIRIKGQERNIELLLLQENWGKHPREGVFSPAVALLCCTLNYSWGFRQKIFGSGENTHLALRQIVDSVMQYEKERVEAWMQSVWGTSKERFGESEGWKM